MKEKSFSSIRKLKHVWSFIRSEIDIMDLRIKNQYIYKDGDISCISAGCFRSDTRCSSGFCKGNIRDQYLGPNGSYNLCISCINFIAGSINKLKQGV